MGQPDPPGRRPRPPHGPPDPPPDEPPIPLVPANPVRVTLGIEAYAAYGTAVGGVAFNGDPLLPWELLGQVLQDAWIAAAVASVHSWTSMADLFLSE